MEGFFLAPSLRGRSLAGLLPTLCLVVSREANVRGLLAKRELGEGDAALVYKTDARWSQRVKTLPIPESASVAARYLVAVVAGAPELPGARAFVALVPSA